MLRISISSTWKKMKESHQDLSPVQIGREFFQQPKWTTILLPMRNWMTFILRMSD
jgi:hypothetical protein